MLVANQLVTGVAEVPASPEITAPMPDAVVVLNCAPGQPNCDAENVLGPLAKVDLEWSTTLSAGWVTVWPSVDSSYGSATGTGAACQIDLADSYGPPGTEAAVGLKGGQGFFVGAATARRRVKFTKAGP
ncbi:MAG TPA: hypothetical protein VJ957_09925 [Longimicrobiales bacterium]|nr:hypothetical protein [Longimicrobiales bacterium]